MNPFPELAKRIDAASIVRRVSMRALSALTDVPENELKKHRKREWRTATMGTMSEIARGLGVSFGWLMGEVGSTDMPEAADREEQRGTIMDMVCSEYGVGPIDIRGRRRTRRFSYARQEVAYRLHVTGDWTMAEIGEYLGGRDHTTVSYLVKAAKERRQQ